MAMQMDMTTPEGKLTMDADGEWDFADQLGHMTMHMNMPGSAAAASGDIEMVFEDMIIYMKMPVLTQFDPDAKPWLKMDLRAVGDEMGIDLGALSQATNSDPTQALQYLRGVSDDVTELGEETVRGVKATHYRGTMDFEKMFENAPADLREKLAATTEQMIDALGTTTMPFDVWIDDQGRAVRTSQSFDFTEGAQAGSTMSVVMDLFDFGVDVEIDIPPASQTSDFQEVMGQLGGMPTP
jgi:hypothetical protein